MQRRDSLLDYGGSAERGTASDTVGSIFTSYWTYFAVAFSTILFLVVLLFSISNQVNFLKSELNTYNSLANRNLWSNIIFYAILSITFTLIINLLDLWLFPSSKVPAKISYTKNITTVNKEAAPSETESSIVSQAKHVKDQEKRYTAEWNSIFENPSNPVNILMQTKAFQNAQSAAGEVSAKNQSESVVNRHQEEIHAGIAAVPPSPASEPTTTEQGQTKSHSEHASSTSDASTKQKDSSEKPNTSTPSTDKSSTDHRSPQRGSAPQQLVSLNFLAISSKGEPSLDKSSSKTSLSSNNSSQSEPTLQGNSSSSSGSSMKNSSTSQIQSSHSGKTPSNGSTDSRSQPTESKGYPNESKSLPTYSKGDKSIKGKDSSSTSTHSKNTESKNTEGTKNYSTHYKGKSNSIKSTHIDKPKSTPISGQSSKLPPFTIVDKGPISNPKSSLSHYSSPNSKVSSSLSHHLIKTLPRDEITKAAIKGSSKLYLEEMNYLSYIIKSFEDKGLLKGLNAKIYSQMIDLYGYDLQIANLAQKLKLHYSQAYWPKKNLAIIRELSEILNSKWEKAQLLKVELQKNLFKLHLIDSHSSYTYSDHKDTTVQPLDEPKVSLYNQLKEIVYQIKESDQRTLSHSTHLHSTENKPLGIEIKKTYVSFENKKSSSLSNPKLENHFEVHTSSSIDQPHGNSTPKDKPKPLSFIGVETNAKVPANGSGSQGSQGSQDSQDDKSKPEDPSAKGQQPKSSDKTSVGTGTEGTQPPSQPGSSTNTNPSQAASSGQTEGQQSDKDLKKAQKEAGKADLTKKLQAKRDHIKEHATDLNQGLEQLKSNQKGPLYVKKTDKTEKYEEEYYGHPSMNNEVVPDVRVNPELKGYQLLVYEQDSSTPTKDTSSKHQYGLILDPHKESTVELLNSDNAPKNKEFLFVESPALHELLYHSPISIFSGEASYQNEVLQNQIKEANSQNFVSLNEFSNYLDNRKAQLEQKTKEAIIQNEKKHWKISNQLLFDYHVYQIEEGQFLEKLEQKEASGEISNKPLNQSLDLYDVAKSVIRETSPQAEMNVFWGTGLDTLSAQKLGLEHRILDVLTKNVTKIIGLGSVAQFPNTYFETPYFTQNFDQSKLDKIKNFYYHAVDLADEAHDEITKPGISQAKVDQIKHALQIQLGKLFDDFLKQYDPTYYSYNPQLDKLPDYAMTLMKDTVSTDGRLWDLEQSYQSYLLSKAFVEAKSALETINSTNGSTAISAQAIFDDSKVFGQTDVSSLSSSFDKLMANIKTYLGPQSLLATDSDYATTNNYLLTKGSYALLGQSTPYSLSQQINFNSATNARDYAMSFLEMAKYIMSLDIKLNKQYHVVSDNQLQQYQTISGIEQHLYENNFTTQDAKDLQQLFITSKALKQSLIKDSPTWSIFVHASGNDLADLVSNTPVISAYHVVPSHYPGESQSDVASFEVKHPERIDEHLHNFKASLKMVNSAAQVVQIIEKAYTDANAAPKPPVTAPQDTQSHASFTGSSSSQSESGTSGDSHAEDSQSEPSEGVSNPQSSVSKRTPSDNSGSGDSSSSDQSTDSTPPPALEFVPSNFIGVEHSSTPN